VHRAAGQSLLGHALENDVADEGRRRAVDKWSGQHGWHDLFGDPARCDERGGLPDESGATSITASEIRASGICRDVARPKACAGGGVADVALLGLGFDCRRTRFHGDSGYGLCSSSSP